MQKRRRNMSICFIRWKVRERLMIINGYLSQLSHHSYFSKKIIDPFLPIFVDETTT